MAGHTGTPAGDLGIGQYRKIACGGENQMTSQSSDSTSIELTLIVSTDPSDQVLWHQRRWRPAGVKTPLPGKRDGSPRTLPCRHVRHRVRATAADLDTHECIVLGAMSDDVAGDLADITTKDRHRPTEAGDGSPLICRGKHWLEYRAGKPGVLGLDHDAKDLPSDLRERVEAHGGAMSVLHSVCPALAGAACVSRPSTSTGTFGIDSRHDIPGWRMALLRA